MNILCCFHYSAVDPSDLCRTPVADILHHGAVIFSGSPGYRLYLIPYFLCVIGAACAVENFHGFFHKPVREMIFVRIGHDVNVLYIAESADSINADVDE